jgi:hypothetical protein
MLKETKDTSWINNENHFTLKSKLKVIQEHWETKIKIFSVT